MLITKPAFQEFMAAIQADFDIFLSYRNAEHLSLAPYTSRKEGVISLYRPIDPLKVFFYPSRDQALPFKPSNRKRIIFGVKNCDLNSLTILDRALLETKDFTDPNYIQQRELTYIVGADCSEILPTCHCNLVGLQPYPQVNSDLDMQEVSSGYQLEAKTAKGEELIKLLKKYANLSDDNLSRIQVEITKNRERVSSLLAAQNQKYQPYDFGEKKPVDQEANPWAKSSVTCVECGGCCYICSTCYCILTNDVTKKVPEFRKIKTWDSCQHTGYAEVAGGGTPRPNLWQRFRQRYLCKFSIMVENFSNSGCTGCGRCIAVCPAGIDIREVVMETKD